MGSPVRVDADRLEMTLALIDRATDAIDVLLARGVMSSEMRDMLGAIRQLVQRAGEEMSAARKAVT